jgi:hypothetical protein
LFGLKRLKRGLLVLSGMVVLSAASPILAYAGTDGQQLDIHLFSSVGSVTIRGDNQDCWVVVKNFNMYSYPYNPISGWWWQNWNGYVGGTKCNQFQAVYIDSYSGQNGSGNGLGRGYAYPPHYEAGTDWWTCQAPGPPTNCAAGYNHP